jgi:hypothetical protein
MCPRALALGLMGLRHVIEHGSANKMDEEFLGRFRERFPNVTREQFDLITQKTLEKYGVDPTKYEFQSHGAESENGTQPILEFQPKAQWLQFLNLVFFHPDGASSDLFVIAKRAGITLEATQSILAGALNALQYYWQDEENADEEAETFMTMLENRWESDSLSEILIRVGFNKSNKS